MKTKGIDYLFNCNNKSICIMEEYPAFAILKPVVVAVAGGGNVRIFLLRQIFPS